MKNMIPSLLILLTLIAINRASPPNSYKIYIGDFDGNNKADFIKQRTSKSNANNLNTSEVFYNPIAGFKPFALSKRFYLNGDLTNLLIGDFNGDGRDDILRQEKGEWDDDKADTVYLLLSTTCACRFEKIVLPEEFNLGGDVSKLYIGDFDGDGNDDFLRQDNNAYTAYVFLSKGDGQFNKIELPNNFDLVGALTNLYIGDFNGDGMDDILRQEKSSWDDDRVNTAYLLLSTGQGTFEKIVLSEDYSLAGDETNLYVGDFNGDGKDDILRQEKNNWDNDKSNTAYLLLSTGRAFKKIVLSEDFNLAGDLTNLFIGDFDGDGKDDVLRQKKSGWDDKIETAYLLISDGKENFKKIVLSEDLNIRGDETTLYVGDFNKDGKSDFLKYWGNDLTTIYLSNGNGEFTKV